VFLGVLFLASTLSYADRLIVTVLLEPIKHEFQVSDAMLGALSGLCFAIFYASFGIPIARWADRGNRRSVITVALAVWSMMTALCGIAQNFWQLAVARIGVGAGEAGAIPAAQSLIADYFPPERRATALSILTSASALGSLLGIGAGGYIAATHGLRTAFVLAGLPGLGLAFVARFTLDEPRQRAAPIHHSESSQEPIQHTVEQLSRKPSFQYALAGCLVYFFAVNGGLAFIPSFLMRVLQASQTQVSTTYGVVSALASLLGTLGGGWWADRLARGDIRWLAWLPAMACVLTAPLYVWAFTVDDLRPFMAINVVAYACAAGGVTPIFAAIHSICGSRRRAMAIALILFSATLFGSGLGPLAAGICSDALTAVYGVDGLRYTLMMMMTLLVLSAVFFYWFGRAMPDDLED